MKEFSTSEFARNIGVSRQTIINWDMSGKLKPNRISKKGYRFYTQKQVDDYFNENLKDEKDQEQEKNNSDINNFLVEQLKKENEFLKEQLKQKDEFLNEQLKSKDEIIKREQELRLLADKKIILLENSENERTKKWWQFWF